MIGAAAAAIWTRSRQPGRWPTPGEMAQALDPSTVQTPALDLIDQALVWAATTPDARLIISMPPQEGKSQRASRRFPLWQLTRDPDTRIAIASYEHGVARRWGRAIRSDIDTHPEIGLTIADDQGAQHDWRLAGHDGGVYSTGIGGALTGRPVDLLLIDDPVKDRAQADSPTYRQNVWDWWTDVASTRLAPGAPVILIMTRWHHDDLAGRLLASEDKDQWRVVNIPAEADSPDDPLGREIGEFMTSARGRTTRDWERKKIQVGPRTWASLYQGRPSPQTSGIFPADWPRYTAPVWTEDENGQRTVHGAPRVIQSWDLAFKNTSSSDYVVGQVWARDGANTWLLDQTRARLDFTQTIQAIQNMAARWPQATGIYIEDKANGPAVITSLSQRLPGIVPVTPDGGKEARAVAVQPYTSAGNVHLPDPALLPSVVHLTEEAADFPNGRHDDTVDALTQALTVLYLWPGSDTSIYTTDDLLDLDMVDLGDY